MPPRGDVMALVAEGKRARREPWWLVAVAFAVSLGVGLAATVLVVKLLS
jgi:hypothetical protein